MKKSEAGFGSKKYPPNLDPAGFPRERKRMIRFTSLRQRLMAFLILPVALLLVTMGLVGFIYVCNSLLV